MYKSITYTCLRLVKLVSAFSFLHCYKRSVNMSQSKHSSSTVDFIRAFININTLWVLQLAAIIKE